MSEPDAPHVRTVLRLAAAMQRHALVLAVPVAVVAAVLAYGAVALALVGDRFVVLSAVGIGLVVAVLASAVPRLRAPR